jgi:hypothetical protein
MVHIDTKKLDAGLVAATPQPTGFTYYQNDRNAYEVILTIGNLEQSLEGCNAYIIWTYEDGSTTMQEAVVEPPKTIRHVLSPALLAKTGQVVCTLVVYDEAQSYRRTLGQWLCQVLPEAEEPAVPPEDPAIPIIQSLLLDAQALRHDVEDALDRAEEVEQGAEHARADAQAAQVGAEVAQAQAEAALSATETVATAARQSAQEAAGSATAAAGQASAAAQSAAQALNNAADAQSAKLNAQAAQAGAEVARDQAQNTVAAMVPNTRTVNGKALSSDITLTAGDVGAQPKDMGICVTNLSEENWTSVRWGAHQLQMSHIVGGTHPRLSIKNGEVVIGSGIEHVCVSGYIWAQNGDTNEATRAIIYHENVEGQYESIQGTVIFAADITNFTMTTYVPPTIINVEPGHRIRLHMYDGNNNGQPRHLGTKSAYLTVWEV